MLMVQNIKENIWKTSLMEEVTSLFANFILQEFIYGKTVKDMKVSGKKESFMAKV